MLNAGFPQTAAFVHSSANLRAERPLARVRSATWQAGDVALCYFPHSAILNEKTSFNFLRGKVEELRISYEH